MKTARTVLLIDEDANLQQQVGACFKEAGHEVVTTGDPSEALRVADQGRLGLVIIDSRLGGQSSVSLIKMLKHNHPDVPILLYSGEAHDDAAVRGFLNIGVDQYVSKGSVEELLVTAGAYVPLSG